MSDVGINPNPCDTCPYRRDTPPGIWSAHEYRKLVRYDDPMTEAEDGCALFLCHHSPRIGETVCRGWFDVHRDSLSVRIAQIQNPALRNAARTAVALYRSGREAMEVGLAGVPKPSTAARRKVKKLIRMGLGNG